MINITKMMKKAVLFAAAITITFTGMTGANDGTYTKSAKTGKTYNVQTTAGNTGVSTGGYIIGITITENPS